jgi:hypothetical protein
MALNPAVFPPAQPLQLSIAHRNLQPPDQSINQSINQSIPIATAIDTPRLLLHTRIASATAISAANLETLIHDLKMSNQR